MEKKIYIVKLMQEGGWMKDPQVKVLGFIESFDMSSDVISSYGESIWIEVEEIKALETDDINLIIDSKNKGKLYDLFNFRK